MEQTASMSLVGHIRELRNRIVCVLMCFLASSLIIFYYMDPLVEFLIQDAPGYTFIYTSPPELFGIYLKLSFLSGFILCVPLVIYQIWAFMRTGLTTREKQLLLFALFGGFCFFALGVLFAYVFIIPAMLNFFSEVSAQDLIQPMITVGNYVGFILSTATAFGVIFEIPVLTVLLTLMRILKPQYLTKGRRYIIVAIFTLSAVITPTTDVTNLLMMAIPMIVLFELSVVLCKVLYHYQKKQKEKKEVLK